MHDDTIQCPDCGTRYKWRPSFANKQMHCRCGCVFIAKPPVGAPTDGTPAPEPAAEPNVNNPFSTSTSPIQQALDQRAFDAKAPVIADKVMPAVILGAGFLLGALLALTVTDTWLQWLGALAGLVAFEVVVGVPAMLGTMAWMAQIFDEGFGSLGQVLFKLAAVCLGTGMIANVLFAYMMVNLHLYGQDFGNTYFAYTGGFCAGLALYVFFQGLPLWPMFRSGAAMTVSVVAISFIPRFGMFFVAYFALRDLWK
ncbi:MAG: hypothetical protein IT445_15850 [Phycisphaeraceae bacterium]|nr:hypothetical protein [Phycisphaeraceae bacterium]